VAAGRFRDDLLRRVASARIELPPLRERHGDITLLARHFAERVGAAPDALPAEALAQLEDYGWPGNVRELYHAVARRIALGEGGLGEGTMAGAGGDARAHGHDFIEQMIRDKVPYPIARWRAEDAFERQYVEKFLEMHGGSVAKASAASGLARRYFQRAKARSAGG
jgi:two-component system response regulator HydG